MDARRVSAVCLLLVIGSAAAEDTGSRCRVEDCPNFRAIRYYEELGCVRSDGSSECCPTRFNCSSLLSADKTKCHYKGRTYQPGERTGDEAGLKCITSCQCTRDTDATNGGEATFLCPGFDCALIGIPKGREDECYWTSNLNGCCPTGMRCVNDTETPLAQCEYKGKAYWEDQRIHAANSQCKTCVCQKGFDGTLDGPWCTTQSCEYSVYHRMSDLQTCAPVFRGDENCCASKFHCPSADDSVVRHSESTTENEGQQCSFGDHRLKIGDELLAGTDSCIKCRCDVPPSITCTQKADPGCEGGLFIA